MFFRATPDDPLRATGSRSQAAAYLTPSLIGHMVGLSVTQADNDTIERTLRAHGVESNKLHGEWTGVSFVRWTRLVHMLREALTLGGEGSPALMLALRLVWEKSVDKQGLLDYLTGLDAHLPVFAESAARLADDREMRRDFLQAAFEPSELSEEALLRASETLSAGGRGQVEAVDDAAFASSFEAVAAGLSQANSFKPAIKLDRHAYKVTL